MPTSNKKAFTLTELIVLMVVISMLFFDAHVEWTENLYPRDVGRTVPLDMLRN